jgi:hypothetical protein
VPKPRALFGRYEEQVTEELLLKMSLRKILFEGESKFQRVQVMTRSKWIGVAGRARRLAPSANTP